MPKSNKKSKSKSSTKQSQKQKQTIVVNVNSNNKRKSTHYHHKNSNNAPSHIVVPSTNHHMMFMPQPQGLPPPNLLGDNNYGIGQNRLLDATLQRMNETLDQVNQNALNNSIQQDTLNDIQQRRNDRRYEQEQQYYRRNDYKSPSARGVAGAGYAYSTNVSEQASQNRARTLSVHSEDELRHVSQMHDLSEAERSVATDFLQRTLAANTPKKEEVHATVDTDNIIYHTEPASMADLASGAFSGAIEPTPALSFTSPRSLTKLREMVSPNLSTFYDPMRSAVKLSPNLNTLENHFERLAIEDAKPQLKQPTPLQDRIDARKKEREAQRAKEEQEKQIKIEEQRVKDEDNQRKAREQEDQLKQLRELRHQQHQKATEVAGSKKFGSTDEFISAYEEMNQVANGSSSEITPDVLRTYNKVRQAFGVHHVNRVANMGLVKQFLAENRKLYNDIKMKHQPPTSTVPSTRFGKGTIVQGAELLTSKSQPKIIFEEQGGGGAKQPKQKK